MQNIEIRFGGPEEVPFLVIGNDMVGWRREWCNEMAMMANIEQFAEFYRTTVEPQLTAEHKRIISQVHLDDIPVAFHRWRLDLARQPDNESDLVARIVP